MLELAGEVQDGRYVGPPETEVPGLPTPLANVLRALRAAERPTPAEVLAVRPWISAGADPERPGRLAAIVTETARSMTPPARTILDLGSGPGIVAASILRELPDVRMTLVDVPEALEQAARMLRYVRPRVDLIPADLRSARLAVQPADIVVISDVVHSLTPFAVLHLFAQAHGCVSSRGMLVVAELPADSIEGAFYTMVSSMLQAGFSAYSRLQLTEWLGTAGFTEFESSSVPGIDLIFAKGQTKQPDTLLFLTD